jgi:hypothetical protein
MSDIQPGFVRYMVDEYIDGAGLINKEPESSAISFAIQLEIAFGRDAVTYFVPIQSTLGHELGKF